MFRVSGSGDHDLCVPYTGSEAWTRSIGYKIVDEWRPWSSNGQVAGYFLVPFLCCLYPYLINLKIFQVRWKKEPF